MYLPHSDRKIVVEYRMLMRQKSAQIKNIKVPETYTKKKPVQRLYNVFWPKWRLSVFRYPLTICCVPSFIG